MTSVQKVLGSVGTMALFTFGGAAAAFAQGTTTPGTPNTGVGGDSVSLMLVLGLSALSVLGATGYLLLKQRAVPR